MIYDRPVSELMRDAAIALDEPCSVAEVVKWFEKKYPKIKRNTITAHVRGMTSNDPSRHYYTSVASKTPVFYRAEDGTLERFDPDRHLGAEVPGTVPEGGAPPDELITEQSAEFVLEAHLEAFLIANWPVLNWRRPLQIWQGAGGSSGHQFSTPVGRMDFLCVDTATNALVVVELKRGQPSDKVVGQVARYMGWVRTHMAGAGQAVEGLIVSHETDDNLRYAASAIPGLRLMTYEVKFELSEVVAPDALALPVLAVHG